MMSCCNGQGCECVCHSDTDPAKAEPAHCSCDLHSEPFGCHHEPHPIPDEVAFSDA